VLGIKRCGDLIASGGNDNLVAIYDVRKSEHLLHSYEHSAAVKSLAWTESDKMLLSGGGTSDKMIKFWSHKGMKVVK
jgi:cell division cycle protein 20 (cofactor of APC complex)